jgi:hypothetical protein
MGKVKSGKLPSAEYMPLGRRMTNDRVQTLQHYSTYPEFRGSWTDATQIGIYRANDLTYHVFATVMPPVSRPVFGYRDMATLI